MMISTSTNICTFRPDSGRNLAEFSIRKCAEAGYQAIDMNFCEAMNPTSALRGDQWEDYVLHLKQVAEECNIKFVQSHLPYYDVIGCEDQAHSTVMEEMIRRCIIGSAMLDVKWTVTHPCVRNDCNRQWEKEYNLAYFKRHLDFAKKMGVGIAIENEFSYGVNKNYCADIAELCDLVDSFHDDQIGICYDFGHGHLSSGGTHREKLGLIGSRLKAVHIADNRGNFDQHFMPFYGSIDWADAMAGLKDIGYHGYLTYEIHEFGRFLPNELKHLVVEQSLAIGDILLDLYDKA